MRGFFISYFLELSSFPDQESQAYRITIIHDMDHSQTIPGGIRLGNHFITIGVDFGITLEYFPANLNDQAFPGILHKLHVPKTDRIARDKNRCLSIWVTVPFISNPSGTVAKGIS